MATDHLLAVDLGTSAIKLLVVSRDLDIVATERIPSARLDVQAWTAAIRRRTLPHSDASAIAGIVVTGQMHGLVPAFDDGFGEGIPWTDQRGAAMLPELNLRLGERLPMQIGGHLASGFQAVSLAWLKQHHPQEWARIRRVMLPKDALIFQLTGRHVSDPSDAAGTGLLDVAQNDWAWDIVDAIGIPREWLPEIVTPGSIVGAVSEAAASSFGLRAGTPVIVAGGDAPVGAIGGDVTCAGQALILLSTGAQIIQPQDAWQPDPAGRWYSWPAAIPPGVDLARFLRVGTLLNAGIATTWAQDVLQRPSETASGPTGLLVLPQLIGERTPLNDPLARGAILGIQPDTTPAAISRAVLEGIAFALRHALETMSADAVAPTSIRLGGGGAANAMWQQIITDVLGTRTERIDTPELTGYGAALLGAHALGWHDLRIGAARSQEASATFTPDPERHRQYSTLYDIYRDALQVVTPISHRLATWPEVPS